MLKLKIQNNLTKSKYIIENLTDLMANSLNYVFDIVLPDNLDSGEYNYSLFDEDEVLLSSGLLQIGTYETPKTSYTAQTKNNFVQYEG